ncbi:MAG: hypothetical protein KQJ78_13675 [Deltaproteobacteria bacterium]|nr:hypothetical protein [Deltaproteobacteria bacterium]
MSRPAHPGEEAPELAELRGDLDRLARAARRLPSPPRPLLAAARAGRPLRVRSWSRAAPLAAAPLAATLLLALWLWPGPGLRPGTMAPPPGWTAEVLAPAGLTGPAFGQTGSLPLPPFQEFLLGGEDETPAWPPDETAPAENDDPEWNLVELLKGGGTWQNRGC